MLIKLGTRYGVGTFYSIRDPKFMFMVSFHLFEDFRAGVCIKGRAWVYIFTPFSKPMFEKEFIDSEALGYDMPPEEPVE